MFAVKLTNFLVFTASEEVTVKCLVGSSDILANEWSDLFVSLRKSSEIIQNCRKIVLKLHRTYDILQGII